jgi:hypothetical protein
MGKRWFLGKYLRMNLIGSVGKRTWKESFIVKLLTNLMIPENRSEIHAQFPKKSIHRRNTGYAVDELLKAELFEGKEKFNFCKLLAGFEGDFGFYHRNQNQPRSTS